MKGSAWLALRASRSSFGVARDSFSTCLDVQCRNLGTKGPSSFLSVTLVAKKMVEEVAADLLASCGGLPVYLLLTMRQSCEMCTKACYLDDAYTLLLTT